MTPEDLVARGFYIFPVSGKQPLVKWRSASTMDLNTIALWKMQFASNGHGHIGWGIDCGKSNKAIIDVDCGKVPEAEETLFQLMLDHGALPPTLKSRTISTGYHLIHEGQIKNSASNKLGRGLDTRGMGGFIVAPGSPGYNIELDLPITPIPDWVVNLVGRPAEHEKPTIDPNYIYDTEMAIDLATRFLETAEPALMGSGGNDHIYRTAACVKDFGLSCNKAVELMLEHWYERCVPNNREESLARIVENAYTYGEKAPGAANPQDVFEAWEDPLGHLQAPPPSSSTYKFLTRSDIMALPPLEWCIQGILPTRGLGQTYGPSKSGKSFLMFDMACAIAGSHDTWFGYKIREHRPVVFVILEGEAALKQRTEAWEKHYGMQLPEQFRAVAQSWSIISPEKVLDLSLGVPKGAVVFIDTQARAAPGINENASEGMGLIIEGSKALERLIQGVVVLVAHSGKDIARGPRGWSGQIPAADMILKVDRDGALRTFETEKVKDGLDGVTHDFSLKIVEIGVDKYGDPVTSCAINPEKKGYNDTLGFELKAGEAEAWLVAKSLASENPSGEWSMSRWQARLAEQLGVKNDKKLQNSLYKYRNHLVDYELIAKENGLYVISALTSVDKPLYQEE